MDLILTSKNRDSERDKKTRQNEVAAYPFLSLINTFPSQQSFSSYRGQ